MVLTSFQSGEVDDIAVVGDEVGVENRDIHGDVSVRGQVVQGVSQFLWLGSVRWNPDTFLILGVLCLPVG